MQFVAYLSAFLLFGIVTVSGLRCWECEDAVGGQQECLRTGRSVLCEADQEFCELHLRHGGDGRGLPWIEKTCKTRKACADNAIQNARAAWASRGEQYQCNENFPSSVCRCCCSGDNCNQNLVTCEVISACLSLQKPKGGYMDCTDGFKLGSTCEFECRRGRNIEGAQSLYCDAFGNWSDPVPTCERITCIPLKTPEFGTQNCTRGNRHGSRCTFTCQVGFRLFPMIPSTAECIDDEDGDNYGVWSSYQPRCMPPQCVRQRPLRHGTMTCTDMFFVGSVCTFQCDFANGFQLFPRIEGEFPAQIQLTCRDNEQWSGDRPCCKLPCPPFAVMDFVVILDSSVGDENWIRVTEFVASYISRFTISDDFTHVAIIRYNGQVDTANQILFNSYPDDRDGLLQALREIPCNGSGTRTGRALNYVTQVVLQESNGNRDIARDVVMLITNGESQDRVAIPARRLRATGALVFVVLIQDEGGPINIDEINSIAGDPGNVFVDALRDGYPALDEEFSEKITGRLCNQPCFNPLHNHPEDARLPLP